MEGRDFIPALQRIESKRNAQVKQLIVGSGRDERNRGWVEALEWVMAIPAHIRQEIADDVKQKGSDVAPPNDVDDDDEGRKQ